MVKYSEVDASKEKQILEAAEKIFLQKGFAASKTTEIADLAGVNHALLHYYFRTKENLFNTVFLEKMSVFIHSFKNIFEKELPFLEMLESIIVTQYDFLYKHEGLPYFIINEMIANERNRAIFINNFLMEMEEYLSKLQVLLNEEIVKGTVKPVNLIDLLITIISLNVFFFMVYPLVSSLSKDINIDLQQIKEERRKLHVELILNWVKK